METDKPSMGNISAMSKVGQSKGTLASQQGKKLSSGSKSLALGPWSVCFLCCFLKFCGWVKKFTL